jgi:chromosome segregation ATPase
LGAALRADDLPPARSVATAPMPGQDARFKDLDARIGVMGSEQQALRSVADQQARRLSAVADAMDESVAALKAQAADAQRMDQRLAAAEQALAAAGVKLQALDLAQAKAAVDAGAQQSRVDAGLTDLSGMKAALGAIGDQVAAAAKDYAGTRADLKERTDRLQSLADLLAVLKQGQESNDEELVEVKQSLKRLETPPSVAASLTDGAWWDQLLAWKYLPALATGLGIVAVGVSVAHK